MEKMVGVKTVYLYCSHSETLFRNAYGAKLRFAYIKGETEFHQLFPSQTEFRDGVHRLYKLILKT
jgi:hypothetical protein